MFTKDEIKRNLLGGLEIALFMPVARTRFGTNYDEALRSFFIPVILFPLTLLGVYLCPKPDLAGASVNMIALLYSLRMAATWALFLGSVYWITGHVGRREHFSQFVIAINWLQVPATVVFLPFLWMMLTGGHTWGELYPAIICVMVYTYAFTAFMAAWVLRIPWELAGFITMISFLINDYTGDILHMVGSNLG